MSHPLWPRLQKELLGRLERDDFQTWIKPLRVRGEAPHEIVLVAPNSHFLHTLEETYRPLFDAAAAGLPGAPRVVFTLEERTPQPALASSSEAQFNPRYVFETFVVGSSNQFAHAAARAVAESPSHSYNPLFLYGGAGLGKTHLLHAIGHHVQRRHPGLRIVYLAAEQFVNELISSLRIGRMTAFRERYRTIDVLLVDDIQFIDEKKERTSEEFFHTFNSLYQNQKQIILSSDSPPRNLAIEERLRSRFEWGLIADLQPPDLETKVAILRRKADAERLALPDDVAMFIARQVKSNIRELEGLLNRVLAFSSLTGKPLSLDLATETLKDILPEGGRQTTAADIIKHVARHYGLKVSEIKSKNNSQQIVFPRQVAMYLCKRLTALSFPEIGKQFNDKHHSTVMHSVEKIEQRRATDPDLDRVLANIQQHFS
jgi:chromosomal replication initiator protein